MTKTGVNNLSQQLCELCGIEPIFLSNCSFENEVRLGRSEGIDICKYENGECSCSECELGTTYTALFPDFEKPENFVRLFNFKFLESTVAKEMCRIGEFSDTSQFLSLLIESLKDEFYFTSHAINALKQAIASEEWEY